MSTTTLYAFAESGSDYADWEEFRNAFGWAPSVWARLSDRYLRGWNWLSGCATGDRRLWDLVKDERLSECEKITLSLTFDNAALRACEFERAAAALLDFDRTRPDKPGYVNHLPAIAEVLLRWAATPGVAFAGFHTTSVTQNPWVVRVPRACAEGEEQEVDYSVYDFSKDQGHWFLFDHLAEAAA